MFLLDESNEKFEEREVLYKIFDKISVNSAYNHYKDKNCNIIKVNLNKKEITVFNNGKGLPIRIHQ